MMLNCDNISFTPHDISVLLVGKSGAYVPVEQCLLGEGYYCFTLKTSQLHEAFIQHIPDLIVVDIDTENCVDICQIIDEMAQGVPIIMHGNANDLEHIDAGFLAGAHEFFPKPLNPLIMRRRIQNILQAQHDALALKDKNIYLKNILSSATDYAIVTADTDFNILYVNSNFECLFQLPYRQVQQCSMQHFFKRKLHDVDFLDMVQQVHQGEVCAWVSPYEDKYLQLRFSGTLDEQDCCIGYALSVLDISQRIHDKKSLLLTHQVFDKAMEGICVLDHQWRIVDFNKAFLRMLKTNKDELMSQHVRILHPKAKNKGLYRDMVQSVVQAGFWKGVMHVGGPSRKTAGYWLSLSALKDEQNKISHYVGIFTDIRQYDANRRLLYQTQKMEAMRTLVGGVAHHFNNMLAGILGGIFLAKLEDEDAERLQHLDRSEELGFQAGDMIHQLALFSHKDESLKHELPLQSSISTYVKALPKTQKAILSIDMACFPLLIQSDETQFEQVLKSILDNAFEAVAQMDEPSIHIHLKRVRPSEHFYQIHTQLEDDFYAFLRITDNGLGIAAEHLPHIFDPFFTTKDIGKGCGLSLAIAYNIVEEHGGVIEATSDHGHTEIHIYFPLLSLLHSTHQTNL